MGRGVSSILFQNFRGVSISSHRFETAPTHAPVSVTPKQNQPLYSHRMAQITHTGKAAMLRNALLRITLGLAAGTASLLAVPSHAVNVPATVHPNWTKINLRPAGFEPQVSGMAFLSDGRLVIAHWDTTRGRGNNVTETVRAFSGKVYVLSGISGNTPTVAIDTIARGLEDIMGLTVVNDTIYVSGGNVIVRLIRTGNSGPVTRLDTLFILPGTPADSSSLNPADSLKPRHGSQEYMNGLLHKDGKFYVSPSSVDPIGSIAGSPQVSPYRGTYLEVTPGNGTTNKRGSFRIMANGIRAASGLGFGPEGRHCIPDNQGDWLPSSKLICLQEGKFYGAKKSGGLAAAYYAPWNNLTETPPTVWASHNEISNSPTAPLYMPYGPYAGQMLMGDARWGTGINRYFLERNSQGDLQGAVFVFTGGLESGAFRMALGPDSMLYVGMLGGRNDNDGYPKNMLASARVDFGLTKLRYDAGPEATRAFEMLAIRSRPTGFEIEFTKPVDTTVAKLAANYTIQSSHMTPSSSYGGGNKQNITTLTPGTILVSPDRKKVFLPLTGLVPSTPTQMRMVHFRLNNYLSGLGDTLWSREAWYTLNAFGTGNPFDDPTALAPPSPGRASLTGALPVSWSVNGGVLRFAVTGEEAVANGYTATVRALNGRLVASVQGQGPGERVLNLNAGGERVLIFEVRAPGARYRTPLVVP